MFFAQILNFISGDTLPGVAVKFSLSLELIKRLNKMYLSDCDLQPGQILKIPASAKSNESLNNNSSAKKPEPKKNNRSPEKSSVKDFFKSIDKGIKNSKQQISNFDSNFLEKLENSESCPAESYNA